MSAIASPPEVLYNSTPMPSYSGHTAANDRYSFHDFHECQNCGGGDCLFLAFVDAYNRHYNTYLTADEARLYACAEMKKDPAFFEPFVSVEYERMKVTTFAEYVARMEKAGSWGGEPEYIALCRKFGCNIIIYNKVTEKFRHTFDEDSYQDEIFLAYEKRGHVGHYTALYQKSHISKPRMEPNEPSLYDLKYAFNGTAINVNEWLFHFSFFFRCTKLSNPFFVYRCGPIAAD